MQETNRKQNLLQGSYFITFLHPLVNDISVIYIKTNLTSRKEEN